MRSDVDDLEVLDAVVGFVAILVVNMLAWIERPTEMLLDYDSVLLHQSAAVPANQVSVRVKRWLLAWLFGYAPGRLR